MKKVKEFVKEHKGEIILGCVAGAALIYGVVVKKQLKREILKYAGKSVICWKPTGNFVRLEEVKELLDLNAQARTTFAVIKEGDLGVDVYQLVRLNGSDVILK